MMKFSLYLAALGIIGLVAAPAASAASLNVIPSLATVSVGDTVDVDLLISGLGAGAPPSVGAFDLDVAFDPAVFAPMNVTFGPFLGDPDPLAFETLTDFAFLPGVVDLAEVSLLSTADLDALQPPSFSLATLSFVAIGAGTGAFGLVGEIRVDDAFGDKISIPEPPAVYLVALGFAGLFGMRFRGRRANRMSP